MAAGSFSMKTSGDAVLVWYSDDDVFHERCLLWEGKDGQWSVLTPDDDIYVEDLSCKADDGPERVILLPADRTVPRLGRVGVYRFRAWPSDDDLKKAIRQGRQAMIEEQGREKLIDMKRVRRSARDEVTIDAFFAGGFLGRRLWRKGLAEPDVEKLLPVREEGDREAPPLPPPKTPPASDAGSVTPRGLVVPTSGPRNDGGGHWVASEPIPLRYEVGDRVTVRRGDLIGTKKGVHFEQDGVEVAIEFVANSLEDSYAEERRNLFADGRVAASAAAGSSGHGAGLAELARVGNTSSPAKAEADELRVLPVQYDEQGERFRTWREVVAQQQTDLFPDWPIDGPRTVLWLLRSFARVGLTPTSWVEKFLLSAKWSDTDRSIHELRSLAVYIEAAGSYDQLNLASLASFEHMSRRWQVIMEAHAENPTQPDYDAAAFITGEYLEKGGVAPELKAHVAKQMRDEAEVRKQLGKVRELKTGTPPGKGGGKQK